MAKKSKSKKLKAQRPPVSNNLEKAKKLHQKGQLVPAKKIYQRILAKNPNNPDALHFLGLLLHGLGQSRSAIAHIERAIKIQPDYVDAYSNLGNLLVKLKREDEAEQVFRRTVEIKPDFAPGHNQLGIALKTQNKFDEAEAAYRQAIALDPDYAEPYHNLGNVLLKNDRLDEAIAAFRKANDLEPSNPVFQEQRNETLKFLGKVLYTEGKIEEATSVYEEWVQHDPENPVAKHMLLSCTVKNNPERASDEYVKETFDEFAGSFDRVLENLDYQAPLLVFSAFQSARGDSEEQLDILDAGCGTGLCATHFKPHAKRLEGVDLSAGMLSKAAELDLYDKLINAELTAYMLDQPESYDLVISADTLIYFGALDGVFEAAASTLRSGGRFIFTVEHLQAEDTHGHQINVHGRYSHSKDYVSKMLSLAGFTLVSLSRDTLRKENKLPVHGLTVVAAKP